MSVFLLCELSSNYILFDETTTLNTVNIIVFKHDQSDKFHWNNSRARFIAPPYSLRPSRDDSPRVILFSVFHCNTDILFENDILSHVTCLIAGLPSTNSR